MPIAAVANPKYPPLRLGAIGTGLAMQRLHWTALQRLPGHVHVVAFAEPNDQSADAFCATSGVPPENRYADYHDLLKRDDLDAVMILLPIPLLYDAAKAALATGVHVFCEKPPGGNLDQATEFLALERSYPNQRAFVAENFFYRDDLRVARAHLDAGIIGRVHTLTWRIAGQYVPRDGTFSSTPWRHRPEYRGGTHLDGGIHMMAAMRLLIGDPISVHGLVQYANGQMGGPSTLCLNLTFANGAVGSYSAVHPEIVVPAEDNALRLYGDQGTMVCTPAYAQDSRGFSVVRADGSATSWRVRRSDESQLDGGYLNEWIDFVDGVRQNRPYVATVAQSVMNMLPILHGLDSAQQGVTFDLRTSSPLPPAFPSVPLWSPPDAGVLLEGLGLEVLQSEAL